MKSFGALLYFDNYDDADFRADSGYFYMLVFWGLKFVLGKHKCERRNLEA